MRAAYLLPFLVSVAFCDEANVYWIRHGEKPPKFPNGTDQWGLSDQGWQRAQCLETFFSTQAYNIKHVMAQAPVKNGSDEERPYLTISPLATKLELTPDVHCGRDEATCVSNTIRSYNSSGNILVCWEHNHMPALWSALNITNIPKNPIPDNEFDLIFLTKPPYTSLVFPTTKEICPNIKSAASPPSEL